MMDQMYTYPQPAPQQGEPSKRETVEYLHDRNAEQALLGACLLDPEAFEEAPELVQTEDFYPKNHQLIWQTMLELQAEGTRVDLITLSRRLAQRDQLYFVGGGEYLEMLINYLPSSANFRAYARLVADKAIARRLYQASLGIAKIALQEGSGAEKLDKAESLLFSLGRQSEKGQLKHLQPGVVSLIEEAYRQAQAGQPAPGLATGFRDLDQLTSGLHPAQLVILGARPSMGKTAFALGLALNAALKQKKTVAIFSLEMSYDELARRLFCAVAKVNGRALQNGLFGVQLLDRAVEASAGLLEAPIYIDDQGGTNLLEIKAKLRRLQKKRGLDLVIIDYLQLLRGVGRAESRVQEISQISRQLKELAKEFQVPILALSQLSRSLESRADKRPMLSDLRESGSIEQDADIVLFLFRPDYYAKGGQTYGNLAELSVAKNRNGPVGGVKLLFYKEFGSFADAPDAGEQARRVITQSAPPR